MQAPDNAAGRPWRGGKRRAARPGLLRRLRVSGTVERAFQPGSYGRENNSWIFSARSPASWPKMAIAWRIFVSRASLSTDPSARSSRSSDARNLQQPRADLEKLSLQHFGRFERYRHPGHLVDLRPGAQARGVRKRLSAMPSLRRAAGKSSVAKATRRMLDRSTRAHASRVRNARVYGLPTGNFRR